MSKAYDVENRDEKLVMADDGCPNGDPPDPTDPDFWEKLEAWADGHTTKTLPPQTSTSEELDRWLADFMKGDPPGGSD